MTPPPDMVEYRKAVDGDIEPAVALLNSYYIGNLHPQELADGFISATFQAEQLQRMNDDVGVFVALSGGKLIGVLCSYAATADFVGGPFQSMMRSAGGWRYMGHALDEFRCLAYGPVCLERAARGRGLLEGLAATMIELIGEKYDIALAFVAASSVRSLDAHQRRLGMVPVGRFVHDRVEYVALVLDLGRRLP